MSVVQVGLVQNTDKTGWTSSADDTCGVNCPCGEYVWVNGSEITWCPGCKRGYKNEFMTKVYKITEEV